MYQPNIANKRRKIGITCPNETKPENVFLNLDIIDEINSKQNTVSNTSTELRRSARLLKKRSVQNKLIINDHSDDLNLNIANKRRKASHISDSYKTKPGKTYFSIDYREKYKKD